MPRDDLVAIVLSRKDSAVEVLQREAFAVLVDFCRDGMSDHEIAKILRTATSSMPTEFMSAIRSAAAEVGIALDD